jgi:cholesterol transport system auxiliary component
MTRYLRTLTVSTTLLGLLLGVGCSSLSSKYPDRAFFVLNVERDGEAAATPHEISLHIREVAVSPLYNHRGFTYRDTQFEFETDYYNAFFIAPGSMITQELREWMRKAGLFKNIADPYNRLESDWTLGAQVSALYGDFSNRDDPRAVLGLHAVVLGDNEGRPLMIFEKTYEKSVPIAERSATALVAGWTQALSELFQEIENDLGALPPKPKS